MWGRALLTGRGCGEHCDEEVSRAARVLGDNPSAKTATGAGSVQAACRTLVLPHSGSTPDVDMPLDL